jgi:hypothetical protein
VVTERFRHYMPDHAPIWTTLGVAAVGDPKMRVQIRVTAILVDGGEKRGHFRELYFPARERPMAHYSYASPDRKTALVVEMDDRGSWDPCRIIFVSTADLARNE